MTPSRLREMPLRETSVPLSALRAGLGLKTLMGALPGWPQR